MKTLANLKKVWANMVVYAVIFIATVVGQDWLEYGRFDSDVLLSVSGYAAVAMVIAMVATYVAYYIRKDAMEVRDFLKERSKKKAATA